MRCYGVETSVLLTFGDQTAASELTLASGDSLFVRTLVPFLSSTKTRLEQYFSCHCVVSLWQSDTRARCYVCVGHMSVYANSW